MGIKGHFISFIQDIVAVANSFPRVNSKVIRFFKKLNSYEKGIPNEIKAFFVRRDKVMNSLFWLKKYNVLYQELSIDEDNLSWMNVKNEAEMASIVDIPYFDEKQNEGNIQLDATVENMQTATNTYSDGFESWSNCHNGFVEYSGVMSELSTNSHCSEGKNILDIIIKTVKVSGKHIPCMEFPQLSDEPLNEYEGPKCFAGGFPWLFPGGVGDVYDDETGGTSDVSRCLERLMRYPDNRFQNDKIFGFYANDYCQRKW